MTTDTTEYEFSHGQKPRGYGQWAFFFGFTRQGSEHAWFAPQACYFTEAKKQAQAEARRRGLDYVRVAP